MTQDPLTRTGRDKGVYYHDLFRRGCPSPAEGIKRAEVKGTGPGKPSTPESEPDFYTVTDLETSTKVRSEETARDAQRDAWRVIEREGRANAQLLMSSDPASILVIEDIFATQLSHQLLLQSALGSLGTSHELGAWDSSLRYSLPLREPLKSYALAQSQISRHAAERALLSTTSTMDPSTEFLPESPVRSVIGHLIAYVSF